MGLIEQIIARAKLSKQRIVLPALSGVAKRMV